MALGHYDCTTIGHYDTSDQPSLVENPRPSDAARGGRRRLVTGRARARVRARARARARGRGRGRGRGSASFPFCALFPPLPPLLPLYF